jgi:Xaa-Pro aminopeptidase
MEERGIDALVLFNPINIRYLFETGIDIFNLHSPSRYAVFLADGGKYLFEYRPSRETDIEGVSYAYRKATPWYFFMSGDRLNECAVKWADEIADLIPMAGTNRRIAADRINPAGTSALKARGIEVEEGQSIVERARSVKCQDEIDDMTYSVSICETAIDHMRTHLVPGVTERQLWSHLHQKSIELGCEWIETRLLSSGPRTNPWFQSCSMRLIENGDLVAFDTDLIGPNGWCCDISRTWYCGDRNPSDSQRKLYALAYDWLSRLRENLQVGQSFHDFARQVGDLPVRYRENRYPCSVHGVGLCDEWPFVRHQVDYDTEGHGGVFEENMTLCIESYFGAVGEGFGVKLEDQVLLTPKGAVSLSKYPYEKRLLQ